MGSVATLIVLKRHVTDTSTKIKMSHMSRDVLLQYTLRMLTRGQHQRTTPPIFIFLSFSKPLPGGGNSPEKRLFNSNGKETSSMTSRGTPVQIR